MLVSLVMTSSLFAESITKEQAHTIAIKFLKSNPALTNVNQLKMVYDGADKVKSAESSNPALYIYDNPDGKGFVIVSGDDIAYPVLGYSFENDFPQKNIPVNIRGWIEEMENRINYGRRNGFKSMEQPSTKASEGDIVVKLTTAQWNQSQPYDMYTPKANGSQTPTGCTATATAIIMYYHKHPERGNGTIPQYYTPTNNIYMQSVQLGHTYNWNNMLDSYITGQYTEEQAINVARLMSDVGCAIKSDYTADGTGAYTADVVKALVEYFDYDKSAIENFRSNIPNEDWFAMIKDELKEKRPVLYAGYNEESGHSFVLDGYTTDNYFSVNWGWGGSYNGYFLLDALNPSGSGIGGNNDHYNFNQICLTNLKPDAGGNWIERMSISGEGFMSDYSSYEMNKEYNLLIDRLSNTGNCLFVGNIMCAHTDKYGNIKDILNDFYVSEETNLLPQWGWSGFKLNIVIKKPIESGDRLRMFYKTARTDSWVLIKGGEGCAWELILKNDNPIGRGISMSYNKESKKLTVNSASDINVTFHGPNNTDLNSRCTRENNKVTIDTKDLSTGTYIVKLVRGSESQEIKIAL